jgi:hypothetical protein
LNVIVLLLLLVVAVVFMFQPAANSWFALGGQSRQRPAIHAMSTDRAADHSDAATGASGVTNLRPVTPVQAPPPTVAQAPRPNVAQAPPPTVAWTTPTTPAKPSRRRWLVAAGVIALALIAGGTTWAVWPKTFHLQGHLYINGLYTTGASANQGTVCEGTGIDSSYNAGAIVTVMDASGKIVAQGHLGPGVIELVQQSVSGRACVFPFSFDVPAGSDFYSIQFVASQAISYSAAQMAQPITPTLGF